MSFLQTMKRASSATLASLLVAASGMAAITGIAQAAVNNPAPKAQISFTFDDGMQSAYTQAAPALKKHDMSGVAYVTTGCVGMTRVPNSCRADESTPYMTWTQVKALQSTYGWEIGSHTVTHPLLASSGDWAGQPNKLTSSQVDAELKNSKSALAAQGINATAFASPYGDYDSATLATVAKYYTSHRGFADVGLNAWPHNEMIIKNVQVQAGVSVASVKAQIDEAIANNQWIVLTLHDIKVNPSTDPERYQYKTADLEAIAAYARSKQDAGLIKNVTASQGIVTGTASDNLLPNSSFDNGLTGGWKTDNPTAVTINSGNNGSYPSATNSVRFAPSSSAVRLYTPTVSVNPNSEYVLKSYLKTQSRTATGQLEFYIDEYDINGNWISGQFKRADPAAWTQYINFAYKPTSIAVSKASLQITSTANSGITAYLDNIQWMMLNPALVPTPTPTPTPVVTTKTVAASADASIKQSTPTTNLSKSMTMSADGSPVTHSLIKFTVSGTAGSTVQSAKIRLYTIDSSANGGSFFRTANTSWDESSVTWNTAPAADATAFATVGSTRLGNWVEVNASSFIKGDGTYSIRITSSSSDAVAYTTKESVINKPQLVLTTQVATTPTPVPTPVPGPTNLVTNGTFDAGITDGWKTDNATVLAADNANNGSVNNAVNSIKFQAGATNAHLFSPLVAVDSTKTYTLSSFLKLNALATNEIGFYIDEYDAAGNWLSGQYKVGVRVAGTADVNFAYTPTSAAVAKSNLQLIIPANSGATGYFDDVRWFINQ